MIKDNHAPSLTCHSGRAAIRPGFLRICPNLDGVRGASGPGLFSGPSLKFKSLLRPPLPTHHAAFLSNEVTL